MPSPHLKKTEGSHVASCGKTLKSFDALEWLAAMPARRSLAKTGVPMFPTRASRWFAIMATTAMSAGAVEKGETRMT